LALRDLVHGKSVTVTGDCKPGQGEIEEVSGRCGIPGHVLASLVDDLARSEDCYFVAGSHLPASVHAAVELLNGVNPSMSAQSLEPGPDLPIPTDPREIQSILTGGVDVLILLGVNPVYDWPGGGEKFRTWMTKAGLTVGHGLYLDETLSACHLALPSNHELESWGYTQGRTNIHSLGQPVIQPLYDTRQEAESVFTWARELVDVETGSIIVEVDSWDDYRRRVLWKMLPLDLANWREKAALTTALTTATTTPVAAASQPASSQPASTQPVRHPPTAEDLAIRDALQTGGVFNSYPRSSSWGESFQRAKDEAERIASKDQPSTQPAGATGNNFELVILPHHAIYDGRFANNAWLQELPHPITRAVWGNFATISPATATQLGVVEGDVVRVTVVDRSVELPVLIQPGTADGVVVTTLGHGRTAGGAVALEAGGVNVAPLLGRENPDAPRVAFNVQVVKVEHPDTSAMHGQRNPGDAATDYRIKSPGEANRFPPVRTQKEFSQHGRAIALAGTLAEYREDPAGFVQRLRHHPLPKKIDTFTSPFDYAKGHRWAMAVDLSACVGCGACVIACQAENNIPVVGRDQCDIGRNMHWLRIDCYRSGSDPNNPAFHFQPMLCQQCDTAPCETVCPVNATAHMPEGINEMTYNRCVGTRYCQNNCPYKVRRFNFLRWHQFRLREAGQELMFNPQVSVRSVGVMEKCTFCIQRINEAKFRAFNQNRKIVDGEIQTACQQACPAGAIVFGDANDPTSRVAKLRQSPRAYHVLEELNTKPSVTYLAKISNSAVEDEPTK
jgi:molybdopterin-containing oxidoreductase family iron-sulfur binding subunit